MIRVGRYTAAAILVTVGVLLLIDQIQGSSYLVRAVEWWPVILILLGVEYLWANVRNRNGDRPMKLDVGGVLISVIIAIVVTGVTHSSWLTSQWWNNFNWSSFTNGEFGHKFEKGVTAVPVSERTEKIVIHNEHGSVVMQRGSVKQVEVNTTVYVDKLDEDEAKRIADQSKIEYSEGSTLTVTAKGQEYSWNRKPRMNLLITVPEHQRFNYEIVGRNGKVEVSGVPVKDEIRIGTSNGQIAVSDIQGELTAKTTNGSVKAMAIRGSVELGTTNGSAAALDITGDVHIKTTNAGITVERVTGKIAADTNNGSITVKEAGGELHAETTNGPVSVSSRTVAGNWNLETTNGKIEVLIPADADAAVEGSGGKADTNLPLTVSDRKIEGKLGGGQHKIKLSTSNGALSVRRID